MISQHCFALCIPYLSKIVSDQFLILDEFDLVHRMTKVLRFQTGQRVQIFDEHQLVLVELITITKKTVTCRVLTIEKVQEPLRHVEICVPLLKKENLQDVVYSLVEIGVSVIQLIVTQKSRQELFSDKEFEKLQAIMIAAAEQSKNFFIPQLKKPIMFSQRLHNIEPKTQKLLFDMTGRSARLLLAEELASSLIIAVGPEGGFVDQELHIADQAGFERLVLTNTVLRAVQAIEMAALLVKLA